MDKNLIKFAKITGKRSKKFEVKVSFYQVSVLRPLMRTVVMDEITNDVREGGVKELLYADDLVLL